MIMYPDSNECLDSVPQVLHVVHIKRLVAIQTEVIGIVFQLWPDIYCLAGISHHLVSARMYTDDFQKNL